MSLMLRLFAQCGSHADHSLLNCVSWWANGRAITAPRQRHADITIATAAQNLVPGTLNGGPTVALWWLDGGSM
eukprot:8124454-Lingulodinium_polyedra.AAC.1